MRKEYFCSYVEHVNGSLSRVGCCTIHIDDGVADRMVFARQEVANDINSKYEHVVLVAFNVI